MTDDPPTIGRYVVETTLGRGAMGVVYRAHDPAIDRVVAIKLIRADLLDGDEQQAFISRFRQEARAAGRCTHPNIVGIYDFALHEGNPFLAMEMVEGTDLRTVFKTRAPVSASDIVAVASQVLAALGAAHAAGIVHRDIKPANIMITLSGQVKVTDFGISHIHSTELTQAGTVLGTPSYMSPEQCRGDRVDGRSDLFSLGVVLYELLSGKRPFAARTQIATMYRLLNEEPEDLHQLRPDLPAEFARAIMRSLAKKLDARFETASDMARALASASATQPAFGDETILVSNRMSREPASPGPGTGSFDPGLIEALERRLAVFVGPIAARLMQGALRSSDDLAGLCATLESSIENLADRTMFRMAVERQIASGGTQSSMRSAPSLIPPAELERIRHELAVFTGPLARVLVRNAVPKSPSVAALWRNLAEHIDKPSDRTAFLAKAPPGP
jgi:serine/threonine protein kinase